MIDTGNVSSFILWGPPGVGKTTLAKIIANTTKSPFYTLSAVNAGVKDVRDVIERCKADAASMFLTNLFFMRFYLGWFIDFIARAKLRK